MNRHARRHARRRLDCGAAALACPVAGRPAPHTADECDGSCHTLGELAAAVDAAALGDGSRDSRFRREFLAAAACLAAERRPAYSNPATYGLRGLMAFFVTCRTEGRALADIAGRLLAAFLSFGAARRATAARLALEARDRRRRAAQLPRLACLDQVTTAPRTGPPAGRGGLFSRGGALTSS